MWWIIFFGCCAICVILAVIASYINDDMDENEDPVAKAKRKNTAAIIEYVGSGIAGIAVLGVIFYVLYIIWYYVCGGFLVVDFAETLTDVLIFLFVSLFALGVLISIIVSIFK